MCSTTMDRVCSEQTYSLKPKPCLCTVIHHHLFSAWSLATTNLLTTSSIISTCGRVTPTMCSSGLIPTVLYLCCLYSYLYQQTLILQAGDVETNPGPRAPRFPCGECNKACSSYRGAKASILCDTCNAWFHADCIGISDPVLDVLGRCDLPWECYKQGSKLTLANSHFASGFH